MHNLKQCPLKQCPFCGGDARIKQLGSTLQYSCESCGARLEIGKVWDHGRAWNNRPMERALAARVKMADADCAAAIARAEKAEREMDGEIDKNKELRKSRASAFCEIDNAAYNYAALAARVKALEEALEPFARADLLHIDGWDDADGIELTFDGYAIDRVTVTTIRRARALLAQREGG